MSSNEKLPAFLVYGDVDAGKSAVISTLCETDEIEITSKPGETKEVREYELEVDGRICATIFDSPGTQHPIGLTDWLKKKAETQRKDDTPIAECFIEEYKDDKKWVEELKLVKDGINEADFLLLVVEADRKLTPEAEEIIETAHLWEKPVGIVLNKTQKKRDVAKRIINQLRRMGKLFCEFDANTAQFSQRMELFEYMRFIAKYTGEKKWEEGLGEFMRRIREGWESRRRDITALILKKLGEAIIYKVTRKTGSDEKQDRIKELVEKDFREKLEELFEDLEEEIHEIYQHNHTRLITPKGVSFRTPDPIPKSPFSPSVSLTKGKFRLFGKQIECGPLPIEEKGRLIRYKFATDFLALSIACFRECARHSHADRKKNSKKLTIRETRKIAGFTVSGQSKNPCLWTKEQCKKLSNFCKEIGKQNSKEKEAKEELREILKEKLLKSLEVTDEHLS